MALKKLKIINKNFDQQKVREINFSTPSKIQMFDFTKKIDQISITSGTSGYTKEG